MSSGFQKNFVYSSSQYKAALVGDGEASVGYITTVVLTGTVWNSWIIPLGTRNFIIQARGSQDTFLSLSDTHTPYITIKAGSSLNMSDMFGHGGPGSNGVIFYLMCNTGETIEILYWTDGVGTDVTPSSSSSSSLSSSSSSSS